MNTNTKQPKLGILAAGFLVISVAALGQLPDGPGKDVTEKRCNSCHGPENYMGRPLSKGRWEKVIESMINRGAEGTDAEFDAVIAYLTRTYGPKVNVNRAPAQELRDALDLSADQAKALIGYREKNGALKTLDDLKKVPGLEAQEIEDRKSQIEF
jgi:competence protein ComEA